MEEGHYIQYLLVKDVNTNQIVLACQFDPREDSTAEFKAKVPSSVTLQVY